MKALLVLAPIALLLALGTLTTGQEKPAECQYLIQARVCEGDPLGSVEAKTIRVLAEPTLVTTENRTATMSLGENIALREGSPSATNVQVGRTLECTVAGGADGKVDVDLLVANTTLDERTETRCLAHTQSTRMIATIALGEVIKLRYQTSESRDSETWLELTIEEATADNLAGTARPSKESPSSDLNDRQRSARRKPRELDGPR